MGVRRKSLPRLYVGLLAANSNKAKVSVQLGRAEGKIGPVLIGFGFL